MRISEYIKELEGYLFSTRQGSAMRLIDRVLRRKPHYFIHGRASGEFRHTCLRCNLQITSDSPYGDRSLICRHKGEWLRDPKTGHLRGA